MKIKQLLLSTMLLVASMGQAQIYTFNDGTARNDLGTGQDGVISGSHTLTGDRFGIPNKAIMLGTTGSINLGLQPLLNGNSAHTITLWVKKTSSLSATLLTKNANTSFGNTAMVNPFRVETSGYNAIYANRACNSSTAFIDPLAAGNNAFNSVAQGDWYHYTYMYDGVDKLFSFINGIFYASISGIGTAQCANASGWGLIVGLHPNDGARLGLGVGGAVDDIHIYNTTLSGAQILAIKNLPSEYVAKIVTQPISSCNVPANLSVSATGENLSYRWSNGSTTSAIVANTAGAYTVTVSGYGTVISKTVVVGNITPIIVSQPMASTIIKCRNPLVSISAAGIDLNYLWSNGGATTASFSTTLSGTYTCTVTSGTCANAISGTLNLNLTDCIADFPTTNGFSSGNGGHFGRLSGYVAGSCANQNISLSASTSNNASTGFDDIRTTIEWRFKASSEDIFNDFTALPQFDNQKTITLTSANLTVGGYYAKINVCGNGICSFRNSYFSSLITLVENAPSISSIRISQFVNGNGVTQNSNVANANSNPFNICIVSGSMFEYPHIVSSFTGFVSNYSWSINGINLVKISNPSQNMNTNTMFGHDAQTSNASITRTNYGNYVVAASNYCGSVSATYTVAGLTPPFVSVLSTNISTCAGATITLPITVRGSNINSVSVMPTDLSVNRNLFSPYSNYVFTASGTRDVANNQLNTGNYMIRVTTQNCGSQDALFNVTAGGASITAQATNATVCSGLTHTFAPTVSGSSLVYAWSNGSSNASIVTTAAGTYTLTINSGLCRAISQPRSLTLKALPALSSNFVPAIMPTYVSCNNQISNVNSFQYGAYSEHSYPGEVYKLYNNGVLFSTFTTQNSPDIFVTTFMGSHNVVTLSSSISNSCATVAGSYQIYSKPTVTTIIYPTTVSGTLGQVNVNFPITVVGSFLNENDAPVFSWTNGDPFTPTDSKQETPTSKYVITQNGATPMFTVKNIVAADYASNFQFGAKGCGSQDFTFAATTFRVINPNATTPGGNISTPGTNMAATVAGLTTSASLASIVNAVAVSLTGSGFVNGATVTVGGIVLTNVVITGNVITGTIPAGSTVINPTNPTIIVQNPGASASVPVSPTPVVVTPTSTNLPAYQSTSFSIYPNPVNNGEWRIENGEFGAIMYVYNAQGSIVYTQKLVSDITQINANLIRGFYIVKVGGQTKKLVVE